VVEVDDPNFKIKLVSKALAGKSERRVAAVVPSDRLTLTPLSWA
jgi:hypothetical protein